MTTTTTTPSVTAVCSGASLINTIITLPPTSVGQITSGQQNVVLQPQLIQRETMRGSAGLTDKLQQQHPETQMPS